MVLQKAPPIEISLANGVNSKVADKMLRRGANAVVENGYFDKAGAVAKLAAGSEYGPFYSGGSDRCEFLDGAFIHQGKVLIEGMWNADLGALRGVGTYDPTADRIEFTGYSADFWEEPFCPIARTQVTRFSRSADDLTYTHVAAINGFVVRTWASTFGSVTYWAEIVNDDTGEVVYQASTSVLLRPIIFDDPGNEWIGYCGSTGSALSWTVYNTVTGATDSDSVAFTASGQLWDIAWRKDQDYVDLFYYNASATEIYNIGFQEDGTVLDSDASFIAEQVANVLTVTRSTATNGRALLMWQSNTSNRPRYASVTGSGTSDPTVEYGPRDVSTTTTAITRMTGAYAGSQAYVVVLCEYAAAGSVPNKVVAERHVVATGSTSFTPNTLYNATIVGKGIDREDCPYFPIASTISGQETYYLLSPFFVAEWHVVAMALGTRAGTLVGDTVGANEVSTTALHDTGVIGFGGKRQTRLTSDGVILEQPVDVRFTLHGRAKHAVPWDNNMIRTGALTSIYNKIHRPLGVLEVPEFIATELGSGSMANGTYNYKLVAEYQGEDGRVYRSAPSAAVEITTSGGPNTAVVLSFYPPPTISARDEYQVRVYAYRTEDAGGADGPYYNTEIYVEWDQSTGQHLITDTLADSSLTDNELLYTEGGVLPNTHPPPSDSFIIAGDRAWILPSDDRNALWVSKPIVDNVGIEFSASLVRPIGLTEEATAIEHMDGRIYVFYPDKVFAMPDSAPNALGQGAFGDLVEVTRGIGCVDSNAIRRTDKGIVFESKSGLQLLNRAQQVVPYFGAPIDDFKAYSILKIEEPTDRDEIWFLTDEHRFMVYNTYFNRWSYSAAIGGNANNPLDFAFYEGNRYVTASYGTANGYIALQETADFTGTQTVTTPWIRVGAVHQLQRIWRAAIMGEWRSSHTLTVEVYVDFDDSSAVQTVTLDTSSGYSLGDLQELEIHLARQKCRAMKFKIYDGTLTGTKEGFRPSMLTLFAGVKRGTRLDASVSK